MKKNIFIKIFWLILLSLLCTATFGQTSLVGIKTYTRYLNQYKNGDTLHINKLFANTLIKTYGKTILNDYLMPLHKGNVGDVLVMNLGDSVSWGSSDSLNFWKRVGNIITPKIASNTVNTDSAYAIKGVELIKYKDSVLDIGNTVVGTSNFWTDSAVFHGSIHGDDIKADSGIINYGKLLSFVKDNSTGDSIGTVIDTTIFGMDLPYLFSGIIKNKISINHRTMYGMFINDMSNIGGEINITLENNITDSVLGTVLNNGVGFNSTGSQIYSTINNRTKIIDLADTGFCLAMNYSSLSGDINRIMSADSGGTHTYFYKPVSVFNSLRAGYTYKKHNYTIGITCDTNNMLDNDIYLTYALNKNMTGVHNDRVYTGFGMKIDTTTGGFSTHLVYDSLDNGYVSKRNAYVSVEPNGVNIQRRNGTATKELLLDDNEISLQFYSNILGVIPDARFGLWYGGIYYSRQNIKQWQIDTLVRNFVPVVFNSTLIIHDEIINGGLHNIDTVINLGDGSVYNFPDKSVGWAEIQCDSVGYEKTWGNVSWNIDGATSLRSKGAKFVNTNTAGNYVCFYDNGTYAVLKNTSGSTQTYSIKYHYHY
jgi:hypothetical protein